MSQIKSKSNAQSKSDSKNQDQLSHNGSEKKEKVHHSKRQSSKENESNFDNTANETELSHSANSKPSKERNSLTNQTPKHSTRHRGESGKSSTNRKKTKKSPTKLSAQKLSNDNKDLIKSTAKKSSKQPETDIIETPDAKESIQKSKKARSTKSKSSRSSKSKLSTSNGTISSSGFLDDFDIVSIASDDGTSISPRTRLLLLREKHRNKNKNAKRAIGAAERREHRFILRPLKQSSVIQQQEQKLQSPKSLSNTTNETKSTEKENCSQTNQTTNEIIDSQKTRNINMIDIEKDNNSHNFPESQDQNDMQYSNSDRSNNEIENKPKNEEVILIEKEVIDSSTADDTQNSNEIENEHNEEEEENENEYDSNDTNKNDINSPHTIKSYSPSRSPKNNKQFTLHTFTDDSIESEITDTNEEYEENDSSIVDDSEVVIVPRKSPASSKEKGVIIDLSQSGYSQSGNGSGKANIKKSSSPPIKRSEHKSQKKKMNEFDEEFNSDHKLNSIKRSKSDFSEDDNEERIVFGSSSKNKSKTSSKSKSKNGKGKTGDKKKKSKKNDTIAEDSSLGLHTVDVAPATQTTIGENSGFNTISLLFDKNTNQAEQSSGEKKSNYEFETMDLQFDKIEPINHRNIINDDDSQFNDNTQTIQNTQQREVNLENSLSERSYTYDYETVGYTETDGSTTCMVIEDSLVKSDEFKTKPVIKENSNDFNINQNDQNEYSYQSDYDSSVSHTYTYVSEYVIDEDEEKEQVKQINEYEYEYEYEYETVDTNYNKVNSDKKNKQTVSTKKSQTPQKQASKKQSMKSQKSKQKTRKQFSFTKPVLETFQDVTIAPFYQSEEGEDSQNLDNELNSNSDIDNSNINSKVQKVTRDINIFDSSTNTNTNENNNEYSSINISKVILDSNVVIKSNSEKNSSIISNKKAKKNPKSKSNSSIKKNSNSLIESKNTNEINESSINESINDDIKTEINKDKNESVIESNSKNEIDENNSMNSINNDGIIINGVSNEINADENTANNNSDDNNKVDDIDQEDSDDSNLSFGSLDLAPSKKIQEMKKELARLIKNRQRDMPPERNNYDNSSISNANSISKQDEAERSINDSEINAKLMKPEARKESGFVLDSESSINSPKKTNSQIEDEINNNQLNPFSEDSAISQTDEDKSFSGLLTTLKEVSSGSSFAPNDVNYVDSNTEQNTATASNINEQSQDYSNLQIFSSINEPQKDRDVQIDLTDENEYSVLTQEEKPNKEKNINVQDDEEQNDDIGNCPSLLSSIVENQVQNEYQFEEEEEEGIEVETETTIKPNDELKAENDEHRNFFSLQNQNEIDDDEKYENEIEPEDNNEEPKKEIPKENEEEDVQIFCIKPEDLPGIKPNMFPPFQYKNKKSPYDDSEDSDYDSDESDQTYPTFRANYDRAFSKKKSSFISNGQNQSKKNSSKYPISSLNVCILEAHLQTAVSSYVQLGVRENVQGTPNKVKEEDTVKTKTVHDTFHPCYNERFNVSIEDPETDELSLKVLSHNSSSPRPSIISQVYIATNKFPLNQEITQTFKMTPTGEISLKVMAESELYNKMHPKVNKNQQKEKSKKYINNEDDINNENDQEVHQKQQKAQKEQETKIENEQEVMQIEFEDVSKESVINENNENRESDDDSKEFIINNDDENKKYEDGDENDVYVQEEREENELNQLISPNKDYKEDIDIQIDLIEKHKTNQNNEIDDDIFNTDSDVIMDDDEIEANDNLSHNDSFNNGYAEPATANLKALIESDSDSL